MNNKKKNSLLFIIFFLCIASFQESSIMRDYYYEFHSNIDTNIFLKSSGYWTFTQIHIKETGGGNGTWAWAVSQPWCSGNGNWNDPYIIENLTIYAQGNSFGILIEDSDAVFIIRNCAIYDTEYNSFNDAGIKMVDTNNGLIMNNTLKNHEMHGIMIDNGNNFNITGNIINDNDYFGLYVRTGSNLRISFNEIKNSRVTGIILTQGSHDNSLFNNTVSNTWSTGGAYVDGIGIGSNNYDTLVVNNTVDNSNDAGIRLCNNADNIIVEDNSVSNNRYGICIDGYGTSCDNNTLTSNSIKFNYYGILLVGTDSSCNRNNISENIIDQNNYGIVLDHDSYYNYIGNNYISNSNNQHFNIHSSCDENTIVMNLVDDNYEHMSINIADDGSGCLNWAQAQEYEWCSGSGSYVDPFVIQNLIIDGMGIADCLSIKQSNVYFKIFNCTIKNSKSEGFKMNNLNNGRIFNNNFSSNNNGVYLLNSDNNNFSLNYIFDNTQYGVYIDSVSNNNLLYNNSLYANVLNNALDNGVNTFWDNGTIGNYWDDYDGYDCNYDNIGETDYNVNGGINKDQYPICYIFDSFIPNITIITPNPNNIFGINRPGFIIDIDEYILNCTWYYLTNESDLYTTEEIFFDYLTDTNISQSIWDQLGDGYITLWFVANDSAGNNGTNSVRIEKISGVNILIHNPSSWELCNASVPDFDVEIKGYMISNRKFSFHNGTSWIIENATWTGSEISQTLWDNAKNGTITIQFYGETFSGANKTEELKLRKDILPPFISIISPINNTSVGRNAPNFIIEVFDGNLEKIWYSLDNGTTIFNATFNNTINQEVWQNLWDSFEDGDTIIIKFFAVDSLGNLNSTYIFLRINKPILPNDEPISGPGIPGYNLFILIGIFSLMTVITIKFKYNKKID